MKLTLAEPKYLKDSISIISDLVNEARFRVTNDGIELVAMDPANVAMVIFKLLSSCFTEYTIKKDAELAINLSNLKQVLKRAGSNDMITLEMDKDNKLKIQLKSNTTRTFYLPLIDFEEKEQKVPELKFPLSVKTSTSVLTNAIEDADVVSESVVFSVEEKKMTLVAEGDLNQVKIEIKSDDETKITVEKDGAKAKYSLEYLKKMMNASKLCDQVTLKFNTDYPLKLDYRIVDKLQLSFILAPRVEND